MDAGVAAACAGVLVVVVCVVVVVLATAGARASARGNELVVSLVAADGPLPPDAVLLSSFRLEEGLPFVDVFVNEQGPVQCVVDTASACLTVATTECAHCNASRGAVSARALRSRRPAASGPPTPFTLKYGSQTDHAERHRVALRMGGAAPAHGVPLYATHTRQQAKGFNVLGAASAVRGGTALAALMPTPLHVLAMTFRTDGGQMFAVHPLRVRRELFALCAPLRPHAGPHAPPRYALGVARLVAGEGKDAKVVGVMGGAASLGGGGENGAIVDTGSNFTSFSPEVFAALRPHFDRNDTVRIWFDGCETPFQLHWSNYRFDGTPRGLLMANGDAGCTGTSVVLGTFALRGSTCVFCDDVFLCHQEHCARAPD